MNGSVPKILVAAVVGSLLVGSGSIVNAQSNPNDELFRTVAALDRAVFDAYNTCDLEKFGPLFAEDVEFYHDKTGLSRSRQNLLEALKKNICGKVRRELIPGTMQVYPMQGFGAVQIGEHRFCENKAKQCDGSSGVAKFIHLLQFKDGAWMITRVISYDHGPAPGRK
jgi:hypothetical protein